jgi:hypothetical protein
MSTNLFKDFLALFPVVNFPSALTLDSHRTFEQVNDLSHFDLANQFILQEDEYRKRNLPSFSLVSGCLKIKRNFTVWSTGKPSLMRYDFILGHSIPKPGFQSRDK